MAERISHPSEAEAVVFDLDGVLIDSWKSILSQGVDLIRYERLRREEPMQGPLCSMPDDYARVAAANKRSGDPNINIPDMLGLSVEEWDVNKTRLMALHADIFEQHKADMLLYEGAVELVRDLSKTRPLAALTTRARYMFNPQLCPDLLPPDEPRRYFRML